MTGLFRQILISGVAVSFVLTATIPALAQNAKANSQDYVCGDDECEAQPLSKETPGSGTQSLQGFLQNQPGFVSRPIDAFRSLLADDFSFDLFGHTFSAGISGRATRAFLYGDNQDESELFFVDNNNSSTQVVGVAELAFDENSLIGGRVKLPIIFNSSVDADFGDGGVDFSFGEFDERELSGYLSHIAYGTFHFGYGSTASDGTSETDLSGMTVISRSRVRDLAGGLSFSEGGPTIGDVFFNFDGLGDDNRFRYDAPRMANFLFSTSLTRDGSFDVAARWEKRFDTKRVAAAASLVDRDDGVEQASLSLSALWEDGFNITGVISGQHRNERDPFLIYAKIGWFAAPFEIGSTAFGFDAAYNDSSKTDGDKAATIGAFVVQTIDREGIVNGIDLYGGLRFHHYETEDESYDGILASMVGVRVRF